MRRPQRRELAAVVVAVAAVAALAVVAWQAPGWWRGGGERPAAPLTAMTAVEPGYALFADVLTLRASVVADPAVVDPGTVRLEARFTPLRLLSQSRTARRAGATERIDFAFRVQCVSLECLRAAGAVEDSGAVRATPIGLRRALVVGERRDGSRVQGEITWPQLVVHSRLTLEDRAAGAARLGPFPTPPPTYRVSPDVVGILGLAAGLVLALAGAFLLASAVRGKPVPLRLRIPGHLTPLDRALALVRDAAERQEAVEARKALERLAAELRRSGHGDLAGAARRIAWSRDQPSPRTVEELADDVARSVNGR